MSLKIPPLNRISVAVQTLTFTPHMITGRELPPTSSLTEIHPRRQMHWSHRLTPLPDLIRQKLLGHQHIVRLHQRRYRVIPQALRRWRQSLRKKNLTRLCLPQRQSSLLAHRETPNQMTTHTPPSIPNPQFLKAAIRYVSQRPYSLQFFLAFLIIQIRYARAPDRRSSNMSSVWSFSVWRVVAVFLPP